MSNASIKTIQSIFASRLDTLTHLLNKAEEAFDRDPTFLQKRLAPDMAPFGTQIAFTCNQPRNFARWLQGKPADNLDPSVETLERARSYIAETKQLLLDLPADDTKLTENVQLDLGPSLYADLPGSVYVHDFLLPNFYFHLVTAYDILRNAGVTIGKADYMLHLVPLVKSRA
jgi:hypothetical protein